MPARACPPRSTAVPPSGATARVELTGIVGNNGHAEPQHFEVELTREQLADLGLVAGQSVRLTSSRLGVPGRAAGLIAARLPRFT